MTTNEIISCYDANIKKKLIDIIQKELSELEAQHLNDIEELYFLEKDGVFADFIQWKKSAKNDNNFLFYLKSNPNFFNEAKMKQPLPDSSVIHFNLKWNDFTRDKPFEKTAFENPLTYFNKMMDELQQEAEQDRAILDRIEELKGQLKWDLKLDENSPQLAVVYEQQLPKIHRDYLLEEAVWLSTDFYMEKRWKKNVAKKLSYACKRVVMEKNILRNQTLQQELQYRKLAKSVAKLVSEFWLNIQKIKQIKIKKFNECQKHIELNERLKTFVDTTQLYSSSIANKLVNSASNTSDNDSLTDEFSPSNIDDDSDILEHEMEEFIAEENLLDNESLNAEITDLNKECNLSLDDLIDNLPQEYIDEYYKNTKNIDISKFHIANNSNASKLVVKSDSSFSEKCDHINDFHSNDNYKEHNPITDIAYSKHGAEFLTTNVDVDLTSNNNNTNFNLMVENAHRYKPTGTTISSANCKIEQPFLLRGTLREYQLVGLNWLMSLHDNNLNGILADEMGLGKTIQTIALIAHLAGNVGEWGPHLIIVPSSVILNWEYEFKKWCPSLKVLSYYGRTKERKAKRNGWSKENAFHVCITSFQLAVQDNIMFKKRRWYYLIIDEAHNIRNSKSMRWNMLLGLNTQRRLLLTGTPLQNNLMELWSLLHFLMPQLFLCEDTFKQWFAQPISSMIFNESVVDKDTVNKLHQILRPFILRRLKSEVELQIPKKYEHVVKCELSPRQRVLYNEYMMLDSTQNVLSGGNFLSIMQILIQLRKVCNHPDLFEPRPVISSFVINSSDKKQYVIPSLVDFSETYVPFVDDFYRNLLKCHPQLKISFDTSVNSLQNNRVSRKRKFGDESFLYKTYQSNSINTDCMALNNKHSHDYYLKKISNIIDSYVNYLMSHHSILESQNNIHKDIEFCSKKLCGCSYDCDGCGIKDFLAGISYPVLRDIINDQIDRNMPCDISCIDTLKKQALHNISRIINFNFSAHCSKTCSNVTDIFLSCAYNKNIKNTNEGVINRLCNVSKDLINEYIPFAINEILVCTMRAITTAFELIKYSGTTSINSVTNFLNRLSFQLNHPTFEISNGYNISKNSCQSYGDLTDKLWNVYINRQLVFPQTRLIQYDCGKLQFLDGFLKRLYRENHRVLIFTQMSKMLDILEKFLSYHNFTYLRLDGSTKIEHRQYMMDLFNNDDSIFTFILSTRAGGLGLNLTGADTVIFYDNDWNPTVDAQAQDRCHRIGQIRDVHIYRLVCRNTIEENILKRAQDKRTLVDVTIEGGNFTVSHLEKNFIKDIFSHIDNNSTEPSLLLPNIHTYDTLDNKEFEKVLSNAEKAEGITEVDIANNIKSSFDDVSRTYDDFYDEIYEMENDLLPIERLALYYLESLCCEEFDILRVESTNTNNSNSMLMSPPSTSTLNIKDEKCHNNVDKGVSNLYSISNNDGQLQQVICKSIVKLGKNDDNNNIENYENNYFKSAAEICIEDEKTYSDISKDENMKFDSYVINHISEIAKEDSIEWLPFGTTLFSIINDIYKLESSKISLLATTTSCNCISNSAKAACCFPIHDKCCREGCIDRLTVSYHASNNNNTIDNCTRDNISYITDEINAVDYKMNSNIPSYGDSLYDYNLIISILLGDYSTDNPNNFLKLDEKLNVKHLRWLIHNNFDNCYYKFDDYDDRYLDMLDPWNNNYFYADNRLNFNDMSELLFINECSSMRYNNNIDSFYTKFSTKLSSKYTLSSKCTNSLKVPSFCPYNYFSNQNKCYNLITINIAPQISRQLYSTMMDILDHVDDAINLDFFRYCFMAISQLFYPLSYFQFMLWILRKNSSYNINDNIPDHLDIQFNGDNILLSIVSEGTKSFVRVKNLKYQRVYKDGLSSALLASSVIKYSNFSSANIGVGKRKLTKDNPSYTSRRSIFNKIHERIKKRQRISVLNIHASGGHIHANNNETTTKSTTNIRKLDRKKSIIPSDKLRTTQTILPSTALLMSSLRKRRYLLESNAMMYIQDKIAKVRQHVSRIAINDHLLIYRDIGSKSIKNIKRIDNNKVVKVNPIPPPATAVSHIITPGMTSKLNMPISISNKSHISSNIKSTSQITSNSVNCVSNPSVRPSIISTGANISGNVSVNCVSNNNSRVGNYQRLNIPKTSSLSMNNNSSSNFVNNHTIAVSTQGSINKTKALPLSIPVNTTNLNTSTSANTDYSASVTTNNINNKKSHITVMSQNVASNIASVSNTNSTSLHPTSRVNSDHKGIINYNTNNTTNNKDNSTKNTNNSDNLLRVNQSPISTTTTGVVLSSSSMVSQPNLNIPAISTNVSTTNNLSTNVNYSNRNIDINVISPQKSANPHLQNDMAILQRQVLLQQQRQQTPSIRVNNISQMQTQHSSQSRYLIQPQQHSSFQPNLHKHQQLLQVQQPQKFISHQQNSNSNVVVNHSPLKVNVQQSSNNNNNNPINNLSNNSNNSNNNINDCSTNNISHISAINSGCNPTQIHNQYNQSSHTNSGGSNVITNVTPNNVPNYSNVNCMGNNMVVVGNQQSICNYPSSVVQQQQQVTSSSLQNINSSQHHLIQKLNSLQYQLGQIQNQTNLPHNISHQLQQQNIVGQQHLQQQIMQLQHQQQAILQQHQHNLQPIDSSNSSNTSTINHDSSFGSVINKNNTLNIPIYNNNSNNIRTNMLPMHNLVQNNQTSSMLNSSFNSNSMGNLTRVNSINKSTSDVLCLLNSIINSGGNVPIVLQQMFGGNQSLRSGNPVQPNKMINISNHPNSGIIHNNNNNNSSTTPVASNPNTVNNSSSIRQFIQQPSNIINNNIANHQQQVLNMNIPMSSCNTGVVGDNIRPNFCCNTPSSSHGNMVRNTPFNQPSHMDMNQNALKNVSQTDLFNILIEAKKANPNIQLNYSNVQHLIMSKAVTKMNAHNERNSRNHDQQPPPHT